METQKEFHHVPVEKRTSTPWTENNGPLLHYYSTTDHDIKFHLGRAESDFNPFLYSVVPQQQTVFEL